MTSIRVGISAYGLNYSEEQMHEYAEMLREGLREIYSHAEIMVDVFDYQDSSDLDIYDEAADISDDEVWGHIKSLSDEFSKNL